MRVFVSSTYSDLLDYRQAATRAILTAGDLSDDMLYWPAEEFPAPEVCIRHIRAADIVILLVAHRYGSLVPGTDQSFIEFEYRQAAEADIPVLSFMVDPDFPWPPKFIEQEQHLRSKLEDFRSMVRLRAKPHTFSSPESLEVAISHALAGVRARRAEADVPAQLGRRHRVVQRREMLHHTPDAVIEIGAGPDGLPLVLSIQRSVSVEPRMSAIARDIGQSLDVSPMKEIHERIAYEARSYAISNRITTKATEDGRRISAYVMSKPISRDFSPSLFASLVHTKPGRIAGPNDDSATIRSGAEARSGLDERLISFGGLNRFLCLSIDHPPEAWTGSWMQGETAKQFKCLRPFVEESLAWIPGVELEITRTTGVSVQVTARTHSLSEWSDRWSKLLTAVPDEERAQFTARAIVPRESVLRVIADLIDKVAELHASGSIHADLKPSNVLITRDGPRLIDNLELAPGEQSPTVTIGWSPPEQLCRQRLSFAADVYALGIMLMHALGAQALGPQVSYRLPDKETAIVVENPAIYLDPETHVIPREGRNSWFTLIERALRATPGERWASAGEMRDELISVMDRFQPRGTITIEFPWGKQPELIRREDGRLQPGWVITDGN